MVDQREVKHKTSRLSLWLIWLVLMVRRIMHALCRLLDISCTDHQLQCEKDHAGVSGDCCAGGLRRPCHADCTRRCIRRSANQSLQTYFTRSDVREGFKLVSKHWRTLSCAASPAAELRHAHARAACSC